MSEVCILGKNKLGEWSLSQDANYAATFFKKIGCNITENFFSADVIYSPWQKLLLKTPTYYILKLLHTVKKTKIITMVSNDISIENPQSIEKLSAIVDHFVVPNKKLYRYFAKQKVRSGVTLIPFYVDRKIFKKLNLNRASICKLLNIDSKKLHRKILIGSFQRDSYGRDLNKPKWQKNPDLLIEILKKFPSDNYLFVVAGTRRHYIINQCKKNKIPYLYYGQETYIDNFWDDLYVNHINNTLISYLYNLIDIYIVTSSSEGGPKAILEAALAKTLTFSTNVGLAPDILDGNLIFDPRNIDELILLILKILKDKKLKEKYVTYNYINAITLLKETVLLNRYRSLLMS